MGTFFVYNEAYVGKCYWIEKRSRVTGVFSYNEDYLFNRDNWQIDPVLPLRYGAQAIQNGLPGAFCDAAPDRWGRNLIRHRHLSETKKIGTKPRALNEVDYLLGVSDLTRQGNLRFTLEKEGEFLHPSNAIPKLVALPKLLDATHRYAAKHDESAITYLLSAGSASLGGARPKAIIIDGKDLFIAKFPQTSDEWDVNAWEWVCLNIAAKAGVNVPENKLLNIDGHNVLLVKRFDRRYDKRIGYISALTLLGLTDGEQADYLEIAEKLRENSIYAKADLRELFRRIVLFLLLNNTDDHLRNHGLLHTGSGWQLSPVFDINPNPDPFATRATSVFAEIEKSAAQAALKANMNTFGLSNQEGEQIISEVASAVQYCEEYSSQARIPKEERDYMLRALELK